MAEDFDGEPEEEFWLAAGNRAVCRRGGPGVWLPRVLFVDLLDSVRFRGVHGVAGILSRSESDSRAVGGFVCGFGGRPHDAQYAALWRLHRSYGDGICLYRAGRGGFQSRSAERYAARRYHADRAVHFGPPGLRHQAGAELHRAADARGSAARQEADDDALSRETALLHYRGKRHDGGDLLDAEGRFVRGLCWNES